MATEISSLQSFICSRLFMVVVEAKQGSHISHHRCASLLHQCDNALTY